MIWVDQFRSFVRMSGCWKRERIEQSPVLVLDAGATAACPYAAACWLALIRCRSRVTDWSSITKHSAVTAENAVNVRRQADQMMTQPGHLLSRLAAISAARKFR
ncbi:hypothetical protein GCM10023196_060350 [Actinoallomurus vinaceus]|uniref:Uncharacterized protein n=2 Tax=Actinoallomurus vinaceus TaxID=1080074 RepID=A0ABP8UIH0_9ACTN